MLLVHFSFNIYLATSLESIDQMKRIFVSILLNFYAKKYSFKSFQRILIFSSRINRVFGIYNVKVYMRDPWYYEMY